MKIDLKLLFKIIRYLLPALIEVVKMIREEQEDKDPNSDEYESPRNKKQQSLEHSQNKG